MKSNCIDSEIMIQYNGILIRGAKDNVKARQKIDSFK